MRFFILFFSGLSIASSVFLVHVWCHYCWYCWKRTVTPVTHFTHKNATTWTVTSMCLLSLCLCVLKVVFQHTSKWNEEGKTIEWPYTLILVTTIFNLKLMVFRTVCATLTLYISSFLHHGKHSLRALHTWIFFNNLLITLNTTQWESIIKTPTHSKCLFYALNSMEKEVLSTKKHNKLI